MSNSVFQGVIVQLKEISERAFGVIDSDGNVVSCTDMSYIGERWADAALKVSGVTDGVVTFSQKTFKAIYGTSNYFEYAVFCAGDDELAKSYCQLAYIALNDAKNFYEEKHDRGTFVKNIIMDNILPGDIISVPRSCTLQPMHPVRCSWCGSWVMAMFPRWMWSPVCSPTICRILC